MASRYSNSHAAGERTAQGLRVLDHPPMCGLRIAKEPVSRGSRMGLRAVAASRLGMPGRAAYPMLTHGATCCRRFAAGGFWGVLPTPCSRMGLRAVAASRLGMPGCAGRRVPHAYAWGYNMSPLRGWGCRGAPPTPCLRMGLRAVAASRLVDFGACCLPHAHAWGYVLSLLRGWGCRGVPGAEYPMLTLGLRAVAAPRLVDFGARRQIKPNAGRSEHHFATGDHSFTFEI